ncbi:hypothetical protein ACIRVF_08280 [Kitasatospora sp. NPDC101157]|uniref:hypothetical protein n=1 Tax=Kitasatospora sp. NPDC101157 TaxID=3364098 RepID=UPI00380D762A
MTTPDDEFTELRDATIPRVDLVDKAANGTTFLIAKHAADSRGLMDPGFVRDLIGKTAESQEETVTMTGSPGAIAKLMHEAAQRARGRDDVAKDTGIGADLDDSEDGLDPTMVLAAPDDDAPGDPNDPGSPAWEAIDAATAQKWTSIAVRLRNALGVMAERELLEAASADPDDAEAAWDLQDAQCALDYVIDTLASFAVGEQAEAELCGEAMAQVGKALGGFDPAALDTVEALGQVAKAGRVLSAANETAIRTATEHLQRVLASLPEAPVAKTAHEEPDMATPTPSENAAEVEKTDAPETDSEPLAKADGDKPPVVVVYDQKGRLIGIVDPADVTPVANAEAEPDDMDTDSDDSSDDTSAPAAADNTPDLEPQPAAEAGTPANAPSPDDDAVTKTNQTDDTTFSEMFKSSLLAAVESVLTKHSADQEERIAKTGDAVLELADLVETLKGRVRVLEEQPATPKVFTNGATPPREQLRGQDHGAPAAVDVAKARQLKGVLYRGTAVEQNQAATDMQTAAIAALQAIHQR